MPVAASMSPAKGNPFPASGVRVWSFTVARCLEPCFNASMARMMEEAPCPAAVNAAPALPTRMNDAEILSERFSWSLSDDGEEE